MTLFNPFDPAFRADPYPFYDALRAQEPVHTTPFGMVVLSRYEDVSATLRSPAYSRDLEANGGEDTTKWAIGVDSDQYNLVPEDQQAVILTSMLKQVDVAVQGAITDFDAGNKEGGVTSFDLEAGGVDYSTSGGYVDDIAADLDDLKDQIISGEIEVPTTPEG